MKINRGLIFIISMVIISLLAVSVVSASENVSEGLETADFEEVVAVEDNFQDTAVLEDASENELTVEDNFNDTEVMKSASDDLLADESNTGDSSGETGNKTTVDSSSNNYYDWTNIYGKNSTGNNSFIFDFSDLYGEKNGTSFLVLDLNNISCNSYAILDLSSLLGLNNTNDTSYLSFSLSKFFGGNNTDHTFLVLDLPGLGLKNVGNSSLVLDLSNLLSKNGNSSGSYFIMDTKKVGTDSEDDSIIDLSYLYQNNRILGFNLNSIANGNTTKLARFLNDLSWEFIFRTTNNLTDGLKKVNWTAVLAGNLTSLKENVNFTEYGINASTIDSLVNLSSVIKSLNITNLLNGSNISYLFNVSSWFDGLNLTKLLDLSSLKDSLNKLFNTSAAGSLLNISSLTENVNITKIIDDSGIASLINSITNGSIIQTITDLIYGKNSTSNSESSSSNSQASASISIKCSNLSVYYDKKTKYSVTVKSGNKAATGNVVFTIGSKNYSVKIGSNGVATLSKKLKPGKYYVTVKYGNVAVKKKIVIKKSIITKNVSKKYKKTGKFTVKVLNAKGKAQAKQKVKIKLKGKTYTAKTNKKGIATFKLPKNLKVGKHKIKTKCKGLTITNKIKVKK